MLQYFKLLAMHPIAVKTQHRLFAAAKLIYDGIGYNPFK